MHISEWFGEEAKGDACTSVRNLVRKPCMYNSERFGEEAKGDACTLVRDLVRKPIEMHIHQ